MPAKYKNEQKSKQLKSITTNLNIEEENKRKLEKSKNHVSFNFEYFTSGKDSGDKISDWSKEQLVKLLEKMIAYSKREKKEWVVEKLLFAEYGEYDEFKDKFAFPYPKNIPFIGVKWARFRLENKIRLIGFFTKNSNVFYVVFFDKDHRFYPVEKN